VPFRHGQREPEVLELTWPDACGVAVGRERNLPALLTDLLAELLDGLVQLALHDLGVPTGHRFGRDGQEAGR